MKSTRIFLATIAMLVALPTVRAQESDAKVTDVEHLQTKDKTGSKAVVTADQSPEETPLKVQIIISEFDGTQKIASLPYTLNLLGTGLRNRHEAHLRFGIRIPVSVGGNAMTYQDVGTNIDALAMLRDDGAYRLDLTVDRTTLTVPEKGTDWKPGESSPSTQPLIRSFRDEFTIVLKNGQTMEGTSAADPVTGHVLKVDVTLNVLK